MIRIVISPQASSDVGRLEEWLLVHSSPKAARLLGEALMHAIDTLAEFPERGRQPFPGLREIVVPFGREAYLIQYRLKAEEVIVARIRHRRERR